MLFDRTPIHHSPTCTEHVHSPPRPAHPGAAADARALAILHAKETQLLSRLQEMAAAVDVAEEGAHGVLRADPRNEDGGDGPHDFAPLRARAHARVEEWAALLGGGRITLSQPLTLPPSPTGAAASSCDCRREAWVVQLYAKTRRLQVAAARLTALPPNGRASQLIDCTWLDAVDVAASGSVPHGLPRLAAFVSAVGPSGDEYDGVALAENCSRLELPPREYVHLSRHAIVAASTAHSHLLSACRAH